MTNHTNAPQGATHYAESFDWKIYYKRSLGIGTNTNNLQAGEPWKSTYSWYMWARGSWKPVSAVPKLKELK